MPAKKSSREEEVRMPFEDGTYEDYRESLKELPKGFADDKDSSMVSDSSKDTSMFEQSGIKFSDQFRSYKERLSSSWNKKSEIKTDRVSSNCCQNCLVL
jgi:hypothetical protein